MTTSRLFLLLFLAAGSAGCSTLDDPFAGLTADGVFDLLATDSVLTADGRSALPYTVRLKDANALYSQLTVTAASDDVTLSLTGSTTGATGSLTLPFAGSEATFYAIAPRNFQESVRLTVSSGNVRRTAVIRLREVAPNRLDVAPAVLRATPGTPFSFTTTLTDTSLVPRAVSGQLPVQFDPLSAKAATVRIPVGRSVAQPNGTASVVTTITLPDTGTFRYQARVLNVVSAPVLIRCQ